MKNICWRWNRRRGKNDRPFQDVTRGSQLWKFGSGVDDGVMAGGMVVVGVTVGVSDGVGVIPGVPVAVGVAEGVFVGVVVGVFVAVGVGVKVAVGVFSLSSEALIFFVTALTYTRTAVALSQSCTPL